MIIGRKGCSSFQIRLVVLAIVVGGALGSLFVAGFVSAQPYGPDVEVLFLVDESQSLTGKDLTGEDESYGHSLYDAVRFVNAALSFSCAAGQCNTGVWRFTSHPTEKVPILPVEEWSAGDYRQLVYKSGIYHPAKSDFPTAIETTCGLFSETPGQTEKLVVILTDGQLGSETNYGIAPVPGSIARNVFIRSIDGVVDLCVDNNVRLAVYLIKPKSVSDIPAGSVEGPSPEQIREEEISKWREWATRTRGFLVQADEPEQLSAIEELINQLGSVTDISAPALIPADDAKIDLGMIEPYREVAEFEVWGLKPFSMQVVSPEQEATPIAKGRTATHRSIIAVPFPAAGQWTAQLDDTVEDNLYAVRPPRTEPMHLWPHVTKPDQLAERMKVPHDASVLLELRAFPSGRKVPIAIESTSITGTLMSPLGATEPITFTADPTDNAYYAEAFPPGAHPESGLYAVHIAQQKLGDVIVKGMHESIVLIDAPYIEDWYFERDKPWADHPVLMTVILGNSDLLVTPPIFDVAWKGGTGSYKEVNEEIEVDEVGRGRYQVELEKAPDEVADYKVSVTLKSGTTVFGEIFDETTFDRDVVKVVAAPTATEVPSPTPTITPIPQPTPTPVPWWPQQWSNLVSQRVGLTALMVTVFGTIILATFFVLLRYFKPAGMKSSLADMELSSSADCLPHIIGLGRQHRFKQAISRLPFLSKWINASKSEGDLNEAVSSFIEKREILADDGIYHQGRLGQWTDFLKLFGSQRKRDSGDGDQKIWWKLQRKLLDAKDRKLWHIAAQEFDACAEQCVFSSPLELYAEATNNGSIWKYHEYWADSEL